MRRRWPLERVLFVVVGGCPASVVLQRVVGIEQECGR